MNPFAPRLRAEPRERPARRAPDHPPVLRRLRRLGLAIPPMLEREMYRRWEAMSSAERFEAMEAEAAMTNEELRTEMQELLDEFSKATPEELAELRREMRDG